MTSNKVGYKGASMWVLPLFVLVIFTIGFFPVMQKLSIRWGTGDNSYCYLIIPLFLYLCWEKKESFRFGEYNWNAWGVVPIGLSVLLMAVGELGSVEIFLYLGLFGCLVGILLVLYGIRLKHLLFPLIILAFIVPLPPFVNRMLTFNLKLAASKFSVGLLRLFDVSVVRDGNIIDLGFTQLQVVDACSGLRYFIPLILMALLFGYFYCKRMWPKILLVVTVLPLSIFVNGLRIFVTGMLHVHGHPELAEDFFHDFSGWVVFMLAGAILLGLSLILRRFTGAPPKEPAPDSGGRSVRSWVPVTLTTILCLFFAASGYALKVLPTTTIQPPRQAFADFPDQVGDWQAKRDYLKPEILDELWADDYFSGAFTNGGIPNRIQLLIPYYQYQGTRHTAHAPQSCMLGSGWALSNSAKRTVNTADGQTLTLMTNLWEKGNTRILGSYFFLQRGRVITSPWANKYWLVATEVS
jgi:exosortase D (VPLPA-CTERM-specific)